MLKKFAAIIFLYCEARRSTSRPKPRTTAVPARRTITATSVYLTSPDTSTTPA